MFEMALADEASGDLDEGFVDDGQALKADAQAAEVVQPSVGTIDHPTGFTQTAAMGLSAPGVQGVDPLGMQGSAVHVMIIAAIGLDQSRLAQVASSFATNGRDGLDQWPRRIHPATAVNTAMPAAR